MTVRDIQAQLEEMYGVEISPTLITNVTNSVLEDVRTWQNRPLESVYPIVWVDAIQVKIRHEQRVINKAINLATVCECRGAERVAGHLDHPERRRKVLVVRLY
jgi:putative transposase